MYGFPEFTGACIGQFTLRVCNSNARFQLSDRFRLILSQSNPTVGALDSNAEAVIDCQHGAVARDADMVAFPELFLSGYPVQDLVLKRSFVAGCMARIDEIARVCSDGPAIGVGSPYLCDDRLHNAYLILHRGRIAARIFKHHLPNVEVFDEKRQFSPGMIAGPYRVGPVRIGSPVCEDAWRPDVPETLAESGAEILLVPNGSPYHRGKMDTRLSQMAARVTETGLPLVYLNMVGGQDDQVFDGGSFVLNRHSRLAVQMPGFVEDVQSVDFVAGNGSWRALPGDCTPYPDELEADYCAMVIAVREYVSKSGFSAVLVGLSGGIDSALVAAIACDAVGPENLRCVLMPSCFTSGASTRDAEETVGLLKCRSDTVGIKDLQKIARQTLAPLFAGAEPDTTEENIQSRLRGLLLMAISNKFGELLLTTGNKSEAAVGYATIYGDMAGGYNPVKDLYKTRVFATCRWRNINHRRWMHGPEGRCIPEPILEKPPSAELRPDQKDQDSLPPYEILDGILEQLMDHDMSVAEVIAAGFDPDTVRHVEQLIYQSEYKRFQSAPGVRLTGHALWLDRRYPIVNHWRDRPGAGCS